MIFEPLRKVKEFVGTSKKVRKTKDVMEVWLKVHRENVRRRLLEGLQHGVLFILQLTSINFK